ncbi:MAG: DUF72 domain-containing protein [Bryobacteraceae bacterium]|nr:DUF72 domain-containing protein [Bryobacteraceae bacterium]MDW8377487.1 DUF72 domain-containing protein [Bryobacterales bacterium]
MNLSLFEPSPPAFACQLGEKLRALASQKIYLGTSSWKYEGWLGQIYSAEKYVVRGRFSRQKFEAECLREYAETFPAVCGDFSFYQFPSPAYWQRLFDSAPGSLWFAFKVPEEITVKRFPRHDRYGARAGQPNPSFLNTHLLIDFLLRPLEPYRGRIAALILEFGAFPASSFAGEAPFFEQLELFLETLPREFRYAVEVRNPEFLVRDYFECLRRHNVAHVFNAWTRMPELSVQLSLPGAFTTDFTLVRALLRKGRSYEEAVRRFEPYNQVQDPNPEVRQALRQLIERAKRSAQPAFIFVNNRLEGNAPSTIAAIING